MEKSFGLKFQPKRDKGEPGPAEYTVRSSERGPRYSLGHKLRDQTGMFVNPCRGPCSVTVPVIGRNCSPLCAQCYSK